MGGGSWDATSYATTRAARKATGTSAFGHTTAMASTPVHARKVHDALDPAGLNTFGQKVRECFDSDEHPNTTPIAVMFDETGSMAEIPEILVEKLQNLFGLLLRKGYCEDPQILVGGIGDAAWNEVAPLQVSQFEADNRVDEALGNIYLERRGGGGGEESYDLAMYFLGNYVNLDSLTKRGRKGYLFIIGDEKARPSLPKAQIKQYIGDDVDEDIPLAANLAKLQETWEVFWIYPEQANYFTHPEFPGFWQNLLGQNVLFVDDINNVCETIGTAVGLMEGAIDDLDDASDDLDEIGAGDATGTVTKALANVTPRGVVASSAGPGGLTGTGTARI